MAIINRERNVAMKKDTVRFNIITLIVLVAYNFAVFMIPCLKTPTFWISWGFTLLSFAVCYYAVYVSVIRKTDTKSRFYGFPIVRIGITYLIAQVAVGGICMALGHIIPWWVPTVLSTIGLALAIIGLVGAETVVEQIQQQDDKLKKDVSMMRSLQSKISQIASQSDDVATKALAEEFRYSDPVSSEAIADAEADLAAAVDQLQAAYVDGDTNAVAQLCRNASALLAERNRLCKLNKN
jgi:hypothetical protein